MADATRSGGGADAGAPDVVVVGGAIAGCAIAHALALQGRRVTMIERSFKEPDRIVGELLQPGGIHALRELGLEGAVDNIDAITCNGYKIIYEGTVLDLNYPKKGSSGVGEIGCSFHHGRFVQRLRAITCAHANVTSIEATVSALVDDPSTGRVVGVTYKRKGDAAVHECLAPLTIVCDGTGSNLRKKVMAVNKTLRSRFYGLVLEGLELPFPNHGHVVVVNPSPCLLYQIGTNDTRLLVDIPLHRSMSADAVMGYIESFIAPQMPDTVHKAILVRCAEMRAAGEAIRSMPNNTVHPMPLQRTGVMLLGDAYNQRHPLTGGGMTVAFADAALFARQLQAVESFGDAAAVDGSIARYIVQRKNGASTINILASALYDLFVESADPLSLSLRKSLIGYAQIYPPVTLGWPVTHLAGLNPRPLSLITHFFCVAFYGVCAMLLPFPTPAKTARAWAMLKLACTFVLPLLEGERLLMWIPALASTVGLWKRGAKSDAT